MLCRDILSFLFKKIKANNKIVLNNSDATLFEIHHEVKNEGQKDNQAFVEQHQVTQLAFLRLQMQFNIIQKQKY